MLQQDQSKAFKGKERRGKEKQGIMRRVPHFEVGSGRPQPTINYV
jgi:hypothetical protein